MPGSVHQKNSEEAYEHIFYWRMNAFMVPTDVSGWNLLIKLRDFLINGLMTHL